jgi:putative transposase
MKYNPDILHRRSVRLRGYDYSQNGLYFVTICCHERQSLFGAVLDNKMCLNDAGRLAHEEWGKTGAMRENIELHEFVVMPNHIHGIVEIVGAHCMRHDSASDDATVQSGRGASGRVQRAPTVGDVVRGYKSAVTKRINQLRNLSNPPVWQRNYYEHIIRNEEAYLKIAEYIQTNPQRWEDDIYHV